MKAILNLTNPLWQTAARRRILDKAVQASGIELEGEIKKVILTGPKTGRLYRRGAITKQARKALLNAGLRRKAGTKTRVIAGANFHRASAKGQSPANDSGSLVNATRAKKSGDMKTRVAVGVKHGGILDDPNGLNRPFFKSTAEKFKPKFKQNISDAIKENS